MVPTAANPPPSIRFRLLGPLTVTVDGRPVPLGGPRQMAVLARLMLTPDQVVSMNQLVESVWDGDEPAQPHVAVRSYISNLRRAIEPNRRRRSTDSCLASSPPGYRLAVDPADIDWVRFEQLINGGRQQLAAGDAPSAVALLREARDLWAGEPFSGLPESQLFAAHHARLNELRETAAELLFEALLADGDHTSVAAEVESAIAENPMRERLTELGMLAFYRSGRQSEALALGQKLRARLLDRLGVDPSPSIDAIELKILNHDSSLKPTGPSAAPALGPSPAPAPAPTPTQQTSPGGTTAPPADPSPAPSTHAPRSTAPTAPTAVTAPTAPTVLEAVRPVGREAELRTLAAVLATLRTGRSATAVMTGEQGIGKTTLARVVAEDVTSGGGAVAWARCVEGEAAPLWPWSQIVLSLLGSHGGSIEMTPDLAPLAELGPSVAGALGLEPSTSFERTEVLLAVTRLLERLAATRPILLIFEDLHWADRQTLSLLNYAASTLADRPVGFLLTWRGTDPVPGPTAAGLREVSRLPNLIRLELEGLDQQAIRQLAASTTRRFTVEELADIGRRCDGNPLFVRELLAHTDGEVGDGPHWSILVDAVMGRIDRLHPAAPEVLESAALFRTSFTGDAVALICAAPTESVAEVLNLAVRHRLVREEATPPGASRFRQPLVAEVLASRVPDATAAARHQAIGHHLLQTDGPSYEAAHHLSRSRSVEDRLAAAEAALALFHREIDGSRLAEVADCVAIGTAALEQLGMDGDSTESDRNETDLTGLRLDAHSYLSWRGWVDGSPEQWLDNGRRQLRGSSVEDLARLERAVMNLIGSPLQPVGPTRTSDFASLNAQDLGDIEQAIERLPTESPARWSAQLHLIHLTGLTKPGLAGQQKALREAMKLVTAARRRLSDHDEAIVLQVLLSRFCDVMDAEAKLSMVADVGRLRTGLDSDLFRTRYAYPALLELGKSLDAERRVEVTLHRAGEAGNPLLLAEARLLWIRHLMWTGQLDVADDELERALADWAALGLGEAVPLLRQRRTLGMLRHHPVTAGNGPDHHQLLVLERSSRAELAFRLAQMGDRRRADECLDGILETAAVSHLCLADQALVAAASVAAGHEKAAMTMFDLLTPFGDRPIVSADGSAIIGPASLYAGLAATAAGDETAAMELIEAGRAAVARLGGSAVAADALIAGLRERPRSNRVPMDP